MSLTERRVVSLDHVPEAQTALTEEDFLNVERLLKEDDRWQEAMRKRGVTDFEHVMIDPWPAAYLADEDAPTRRLNRPLTYVRRSEARTATRTPSRASWRWWTSTVARCSRWSTTASWTSRRRPGEYTTGGMRAERNIPHYATNRART